MSSSILWPCPATFSFSFIILLIYYCIIFSGKPTDLFDWQKRSWLVGYCQLLSAATKPDLWQINFGLTFQKSFPMFILVTYKYFGGLCLATLLLKGFFIAWSNNSTFYSRNLSSTIFWPKKNLGCVCVYLLYMNICAEISTSIVSHIYTFDKLLWKGSAAPLTDVYM